MTAPAVRPLDYQAPADARPGVGRAAWVVLALAVTAAPAAFAFVFATRANEWFGGHTFCCHYPALGLALTAGVPASVAAAAGCTAWANYHRRAVAATLIPAVAGMLASLEAIAGVILILVLKA